MDAIIAFFVAHYLKYLVTLLVLVGLDLILAVGAALKLGTFSWAKIGDFYRTNVVPKVIGWVGLSLLVHLSAQGLLTDDVAPLVTDVGVLASWGVVVATLTHSILKNARGLYLPPTTPSV